MATRFAAPVSEHSGGATRARVIIVDDSVVVRMIVQRIIAMTERFEVVAHASSAEAALDALDRTSVDIILLDVEMPGMDGIAAIPALREKSGNAAILMLSSHCAANAERSVQAMTMGASDTLLKPATRDLAGQFAKKLEAAMLRIAPGARRAIGSPGPMPPTSAAPDCLGPVACLAIAASTGGVHALAAFFAALPREIATPILITQHLPPDFMPVFARQIGAMTGRVVGIARDGGPIPPGAALVAPGDAHLGLCRIGGAPRVRLDRRPAPSGCRPSADPMFATLAEVYGARAIGVVLSGMGRDGAQGAALLAQAGSELLVQDEASSVVWGMPGAVARAGIARKVAPPAVLAEHVAHRVRLARWM